MNFFKEIFEKYKNKNCFECGEQLKLRKNEVFCLKNCCFIITYNLYIYNRFYFNKDNYEIHIECENNNTCISIFSVIAQKYLIVDLEINTFRLTLDPPFIDDEYLKTIMLFN